MTFNGQPSPSVRSNRYFYSEGEIGSDFVDRLSFEQERSREFELCLVRQLSKRDS